MAVPGDVSESEFQYHMLKRGSAATCTKLDDAISYLNSNDVTVPEVMQARRLLERWIGDHDARIDTPGLTEAGRAVENDPDLDVIGEYAALRQTAVDIIAWMDINQPVEVTYAPSQTKNIRDQFQLFVDGVDMTPGPN